MEDQPITPETAEQTPTPEAPPEKPINNKLAIELEKYKKLAKDYESKIKNSEIDAAKKNQEWQRVAEIKEQEAKEISEKYEGFKKSFVHEKKMSSIREQAIASGLRKESIDDLKLIDFPEVSLDPTDEGNFTVSGADKAIQRLKALRPHWFNSAAPTVNTTTPSVTSASKISLDDIKKAENEAKKTGDYKSATALYLAYKKQGS